MSAPRLFATKEQPKYRKIASLTLDDARRAIAAGERQANEFKIPYNIAVVDAGGARLTIN